MISGAGMLDFLACHSIEKLVMDAEAIASAQRLLSGIDFQDKSLAAAMFAQTGLSGDFLKLKETRALFRREQHFPSQIIDRSTSNADGAAPLPDTFARSRTRVEELLRTYQRPALAPEIERELGEIVTRCGVRGDFLNSGGIHAPSARAASS
jgi:trimethylamine---corrinoid protein Co-methyltransferase